MTQEITRDYDGHFAVLKVVKITGEILCATDHFTITSYNENDQERTSVHYTGGDPSMYVGRGRKPRINSYAGILTDTLQNGELMSAWLYTYERFLRGTRCVKSKAIVEILMRDQYRKGYIVSCKLDYDANNKNRGVFSFAMFIIDKGSARWRNDIQLRVS